MQVLVECISSADASIVAEIPALYVLSARGVGSVLETLAVLSARGAGSISKTSAAEGIVSVARRRPQAVKGG